jgi:hypothetical protein
MARWTWVSTEISRMLPEMPSSRVAMRVTGRSGELTRVSGTEVDGAKAGRAQLTSSERLCPKPTGKDVVACGALRGRQVTVVVR